MLEPLPKQAETKLIAFAGVAHLLLHPPLLPSRTQNPPHLSACQPQLSESDRLRSFTGIAMRVIKAVPSCPTSSVSVSGISGPSTPQSYHSPCLLARQSPRLASQLVRGKSVLGVHTRKHGEATREHQVNLTQTSQQHLTNSAEKPWREGQPRGGVQRRQFCTLGTRGRPCHSTGRGDSKPGNKDGGLNKRLQKIQPQIPP